MPKKTNIRGDLKKYKQTKKKKTVQDFIPGIATPIPLAPNPPTPEPVPIPTPTFEQAATAYINNESSWAGKEMEFKRQEMDRIIQMEEDRVLKILSDPNQLISPFQRTIYMNCGHKVASYINTIKLHTFYYCWECVLFKKVQEVVY